MFRTDSKVPGWANLLLGLLPFVLMMSLYMSGAHNLRYQEANNDGESTASSKLMPLPGEMLEGIKSKAVDNNELWLDTWASLRRFAIGLAIVSLGIIVGLYMGCFPYLNAILHRFFVFADKVPPLLLLPVLFIYFDVGEFSKIALIVIGVFPGVVLDACMRTKEIPREQFDKAKTLGASEHEIAWSVVLPQIFPKMLATLRLNFKAAWGYVIAGESIAAAVGIGYRIFVLRRYVAMDIIFPYVLWATLIMFLIDYAFQRWENSYPWANS